MKADFTRKTFHRRKHFSGVLLQQGRVQLDADWNEQGAILQRYLRALAADLIGPDAGPKDHLGFAISSLTTGAGSVKNDFIIGAGHYYVDGVLCEVESAPIPITKFFDDNRKKIKIHYWPHDDLAFSEGQYVEVSGAGKPLLYKIDLIDAGERTLTLDREVSQPGGAGKPRVRRLTTYLTQPDYPSSPEDLQSESDYLVYLDVWERLVTCVEDDSIRETALGGPDTAARSKIIWQVKIAEGTLGQGDLSPCERFQLKDSRVLAPPLDTNRGWLKAMAAQDAVSSDPCLIAPSARYRGAENQLYRVEIHRGGLAWDGKVNPADAAAAATFKWSRENGSVVYPIVSGGGTNTVTLENSGRDDRFGLADSDFVEVVDDDYVLQNGYAPLLQAHPTPASLTVKLTGTPSANVGKNPAKHPLLRRWDQKGSPEKGGLQLSEGAALIVENEWLELENGVQIQFQAHDEGQFPNQYRTGDYWLIPARVATGDVEWPRVKGGDGKLTPLAKRPDGVEHHYASLAVVTVNNGAVNVTPPVCQQHFTPPVKPPIS